METKAFLAHLDAFIKAQCAITESWNGEDATFMHEGVLLREDDVHLAQDRLEAAENLKKFLTDDE